ncbi:MAG TPA: hypothetical protein VE338_21225, partial [Ktedonobacterales bacterium]|nr:hypothetical protein [Ktedonobacterales bacterium]
TMTTTTTTHGAYPVYPLGAVGTLMQWTLDDERVLRTPAAFDAAMRAAVAANDQTLFDLLCEVSDHLGQRATLIEAHPEDKPRATLVMRFTDGYELFCWSVDCWFD